MLSELHRLPAAAGGPGGLRLFDRRRRERRALCLRSELRRGGLFESVHLLSLPLTRLARIRTHILYIVVVTQLDESVERGRRIERARQAWGLFVSVAHTF